MTPVIQLPHSESVPLRPGCSTTRFGPPMSTGVAPSIACVRVLEVKPRYVPSLSLNTMKGASDSMPVGPRTTFGGPRRTARHSAHRLDALASVPGGALCGALCGALGAVLGGVL